jgi:RNA recognition motif-containing protein
MKARPHTLDNRIVEAKRTVKSSMIISNKNYYLFLIQVPRGESHKSDTQSSVKKLYLGGIKEPITEDDLKDYFSKYGTITDAIVMKDRDGQYRG